MYPIHDNTNLYYIITEVFRITRFVDFYNSLSNTGNDVMYILQLIFFAGWKFVLEYPR